MGKNSNFSLEGQAQVVALSRDKNLLPQQDPASILDLLKSRFIPLNGSETLHLSPFGYQSFESYTEDRSWKPNPFYATDRVVVSHAEGKYWIAFEGGYYTRFLCLDLDQGPDLEDRLQRVLMAFNEAEPKVYTSPGCGLHFRSAGQIPFGCP